MIKNYIKIAWRSLLKHKAYSFINIAGLSIGLTACLIVATVVFDELSYDRQWSKGDNVYRILCSSTQVKDRAPMSVGYAGIGPTLKRELPEVENYCRMSTHKERLKLGSADDGVEFIALDAEPTVWDVLNFDILQGDPRKFVAGKGNLVITEKVRDQYFPGQDPIGKVIKNVPTFGDVQEYVVTGVIKSIPQNSHLRSDIITLSQYRAQDNVVPKDGYATFLPGYIMLKPGTDAAAFTKKMNQWYSKYFDGKPDYVYQFQPFKDIYLKSSQLDGYQKVAGNIRNVYIFAVVAALLLIIACINFVNLTVSRVFNRAKETGIRKVLGAEKMQLVIRFLSESVIFFVIALGIAMVLYPLFIKPVEAYLGHELVLNMQSGGYLFGIIGIVLLISLLTGLYPAWYLSRPKPIAILKDKLTSRTQLSYLKKALVVGQFAITATIIIVSIVVHTQLNFVSTKDLGFKKDNLLSLSFNSWGNKGGAFKQTLSQLPGVEQVSITSWYPASGGPGNMSKTVDLPGTKTKINIFFIDGDADLPAVLGLKTKTGRLFDRTKPSDVMNADSAMNPQSQATKDQLAVRPLLTTAYTAKLLGLKAGEKYKFGGVPIGIVEDFHGESLHTKLQPTFIHATEIQAWGSILIRVKPGQQTKILNAVNKEFKKFFPDKPFKYDWVADAVNDQYKADHKLQQLFTCFSVLMVFLACLGLFGLVSFTAEQRVKEIGIRKVLGASVANINALISKDYLVLVAISIIVASPIAWYFMQQWLQDFAYRIHIQWWVFALATVITLLIALVTISFQTIKAALADPAKSLRSE
ncbi:ABC transporter permease [Mucilaginibacter myungsuensis]|uniref:ABC transporter permease n=1 Tax=Mucilaginibacter myungsuensis TaxID=649104 RepID=A0A929KZN1_9SPHI|nr:ABC transporter permease [Mucilaginibacter myungsuensis]MBE9660601.1 ABC transporter permease [Mucilaginibacter myungsuensis]MDN3600645.1 ABC transporter permease [Mucilaginibacter myungsuensis]